MYVDVDPMEILTKFFESVVIFLLSLCFFSVESVFLLFHSKPFFYKFPHMLIPSVLDSKF